MNRISRLGSPRVPAVLAMLVLGAAAASAQSVSITVQASAQECGSLLEYDGRLYAGLTDGGLSVRSITGDGTATRWTTREGLGGNRVTDLYLHDDVLWVATEDAGLTRIDLAGATPDYHLFLTNIGDDLSVAAVAVTEVGGKERAYFGLVDGGVGVISDGLPGQIFTFASTDGALVDDAIRDMIISDGDLWIATAAGISRLRDNAFADVSEGLGHESVACLLDDADAGLLAGDASGVWSWDESSGTWSDFGGLGASVIALVRWDDAVWALSAGSGATGRLHRWDGSAWDSRDLPEDGALTLAGGTELWTGGSRRPISSNYKALHAWVAGSADGADWTLWNTSELAFSSVDGVAVDPDGDVWAGARLGAGFSEWSDEAWTQHLTLAADAADSVGAFNIDGGYLDVHALPDGEIWMTQFGSGVIRYRPDEPDCDHLSTDTSEIAGNRVLRIADHPDGPVILMSDRQGVDVILDPDAWRDADQWLHLPTGTPGLGSTNVSDACVGATPDQIWFVVKNVGLVLWDVNGAAGGDAELTWTDDSDDIWTDALTGIDGTTYDLTGAKAVEVASDGSVWVGGGGGVLHFSVDDYDADGIDATLLHVVHALNSTNEVGLMQSSVLDIELDRNGDLWAAHAAGLDRVVTRTGTLRVDAFSGPVQFAGYSLLDNYSADILAGLPGGLIRELDSSEDGSLIVAGSEGGLILVEVSAAGVDASGPLDQLYLYPNPLRPDRHAGLYLGDVVAEVAWGEYALTGGAHVEVYDLEGQLIYRDRHVAADTAFWNGENLEGQSVAPGVYMVRIELDGQTVVKAVTLLR